MLLRQIYRDNLEDKTKIRDLEEHIVVLNKRIEGLTSPLYQVNPIVANAINLFLTD